MAEKKIDINAKVVNGVVTTKEYKTSVSINDIDAKNNLIVSNNTGLSTIKDAKTSVSIKDIAADIKKNKQYNTGKFDTKLKVTLTGFGEETIPNDASFGRIYDLFSQVDNVLLKPIKVVNELKLANDLFSKVSSFQRVVNEVKQSQDQISSRVSKSLFHSRSANDTPFLNTSKVLSSNYSNQDTFDVSLYKLFVNIASNQDIQFTNISKVENETQLVLDAFSRTVNYFKSLQDVVDATDDFCQICPDDDQTASFTKVVKDLSEAFELFVKNINKPFIEALLITDTDPVFNIAVTKNETRQVVDNGHQSSVNKVLIDEFSFNDFSFRSTQKVILDNSFTSQLNIKSILISKIDILNIGSLIRFEVSTLLDDIYTSIDEVSIQWDAFYEIYDINSSADSLVYQLETSYLDNLELLDIPFFEFNKTFSSLASSLEEILLVANFIRNVDSTTDSASDDQTAFFSKVISDNPIYNEILTFDTAATYEDIYASFEEASITANNVLLSETSKNDQHSVLIQPVTLDIFSNIESLIFNSQIVLSSDYTTTDILDRVYTALRSFSEQLLLSTILVINTNIVQASVVNKLDEISRIVNYNRSVDSILFNLSTDIVFSISYNLQDSSTSLDQTQVSLLFNILDVYTGVDTPSLSPNKRLIDTFSSFDSVITDIFTSRKFEDEVYGSDSGLINNQSYFSQSYVDPGYVGTNRTI